VSAASEQGAERVEQRPPGFEWLTDELREQARELVRRTRLAQGLPEHIEDEVVLRQAGRLLRS
jgi:hypothetical protein